MLKRVILPILIASMPAWAMANDAVRLHGTLLIESSRYTTKFIMRSAENGGPADHLFRAWANPGLTLEGSYQGADVEFYGTSLVVILPTTKSMLTFAVDGSTPPVPRPEGFQTTVYGVAGLNHEAGPAVARYHVKSSGGVSPMDSCELNCDEYGFEPPDPWFSGGAGSCNSGGPGATSCSQTSGGGSCSVSCGNGMYACCTVSAMSPPKCYCVRG